MECIKKYKLRVEEGKRGLGKVGRKEDLRKES